MADPNQNTGINPIIAALIGAGGATVGNLYGKSQANAAVPPQLSQLLQMSADRAAYQQPLVQAQTQGLYQMLPNFAKNGTTMPTTMPSSSPSNSNTGMNPLLSAGLGASAAAALAALGKNGASGDIPFSGIVNALKKLFGGGQNGIQPYTGPDYGPTQLQNQAGNLPGLSDADLASWLRPDNGLILPSDPGVYYGGNGGGAMPSDPSGGTGVGPGMADYYNEDY